jgi:hypothetical protein
MTMTRGLSATALSLAAILAISACSRPAPPEANSAASSGTATSTTTTSSIDTTGMPPACVAYVNRVESCVARIGNNNPQATEQLRQQMADFRRRIAGADPAAAGRACEQVTRIFNSISGMFGCGA